MGTEGDSRAGVRRRSLLGRIVIDTRPLKIRDFRRLWLSTGITAMGSQVAAVAAPKQVYDLTGSSGWVGLTGAVGLVSLIVFGLWGGAIADAFDRRTVIIVCGVGVMVTSALLWAQSFVGLDSVWVVLVLLGVQQAFAAVSSPTRSAVIPRLVPGHLVAPANALGFTVYTVGAVFGPLAAGTLIPLVGLSTLYLVDTVALALVLPLVLRLPAMPPEGNAPARAGVRDIVAGFRYMATKTVLLASFLIDIIAMVFGMPRALFPEMAAETFGGGFALGWLYAAIPIGAAVCGLFSGWLSRLPRQGVVVTFAVIVWGGAMVGFGLSAALPVAVAFLALGGAADLVSAVHRGAILQTASTDEMRGRMQGVFTVVVAGGPYVADVMHGWAATAIGPAAATVVGGLLVIIVVIGAVAALPAFWRYIAPADTTPNN